ncbi:MAG: PorP/SprF family type IX secretion system membrane protein [Flavobacteriales bacterium]
MSAFPANGFRLQATGHGLVIALRKLVARGPWLMASFFPVAFTQAQDIHFSQFFRTPMATAPANIGQFDGAYRFSGVFRQQWRSVTKPYRTFGIGGDARNVKKVEGFGLGAWLFNDRAGDSHMNTFRLNIGGSYTRFVDAAKQHAITGGLQTGFTSISIDYSDLNFDAQYNGFYYDPALANNETFVRDGLTHFDLHAGVGYHYVLDKRKRLDAGLSLYNLTTPTIGFMGGPGSPLDVRFAFNAIGQLPIAAKVDVLPMLEWNAQGKFREFILGGSVRFIQTEVMGLRRAVHIGGYWRWADAGYLFAGVEYDDWDIGISYDINVSELVPASRNRGAIELTAIYILGRSFTLPRYKACPDQL